MRAGVGADVGGEDLHHRPVVLRGVFGDALEGVDAAQADLHAGKAVHSHGAQLVPRRG